MWQNSLPETEPYVPRAERVSFDMAVRCRRGGTRPSVVLRNLTCGGARIEADVALVLGETLEVMLPTLAPKRASVVWVEGAAAGIEFDRPLHPDVFETLVLHHAQWRARSDEDRATHGQSEPSEPAMPRPPQARPLFARPRLGWRGVPAAA